jgi:hypothetical protein
LILISDCDLGLLYCFNKFRIGIAKCFGNIQKIQTKMTNSYQQSEIHNEVEIIDFLVDNDAMIKDFSRSQLTWFFVDRSFHIIMFLAESEKPKFERYVVEQFADNMNDMISLWNKFDQRIQAGFEVRVMKLAKNKIHDLITMSETFRALFGKRDFEEE